MNSLERVRREANMTQQYIADKLEIAVSTYSQYETGARGVPRERAEKICKLLNCELNDIFLPERFTVSKT